MSVTFSGAFCGVFRVLFEENSLLSAQQGAGKERGQKQMELLTAQDEQEFLNAVATRFCPNCGAAIIQPPRGRMKKFCSDACRFQWKNKHPKPENWKSTRVAVCPVCGKEFMASREYKRKRKYCSRACANRGRAAERRSDADVGREDGRGTQ